MNPKRSPELRRAMHEAECRDACQGCATLRRVAGRWQVLVNGSWRNLDPVAELGEPVR